MAVTNTGIVERVITGVHDANFVRPLTDNFIDPNNWTISDWTLSGETFVGNASIQESTQEIFDTILFRDLIISFKVDASSGQVAVYMDGQPKTWISESGEYEYEVRTSAKHIEIDGRNSFPFTGSVYDISVKQLLVTRESTATNTGAVERSITGVHDANFVRPLGDEEVTNGDFSSDLSGWSSVSNVVWSSNFGGSAFFNGIDSQFRQSESYVVGKTYIISWEVKENNGCNLLRVYNNNSFTNIADNYVGVHSIEFTQTSGSLLIFRNGTTGSDITIDNISVKEMLVTRESTATNTGVVERGVTGVNESDLWLDSESTSVVNNLGVTERPITGVNESDEMFPNNTISNIINLAGNLLVALFDAFKTRVLADGGTVDNEVGLDIDNFDDTASLTMLPNAYKNGTLYSVLPDDGTGDFDVVRGSSATRVDASGLIGMVSSNAPRIDYTDGTPSLLTEPQSTNLVPYSEDFTEWSKTQATIEGASVTLPNGLTNGYKLFANTIPNASHRMEVLPFPTATIGQAYTISLFVKSAGSDFIQIAASTGLPSKYQNFNLSTGAKASGDATSSSITDFGNGWFRISVTETTTGTSARYLVIPILSDTGRNPQFTGTAEEDGAYVFGAQLEEKSKATSYIPTSGAIATRLEDKVKGAGDTTTFNSTEGVLYFEGSALLDANGNRWMSLTDGTTSNYVILGFMSSTGLVQAFVNGGGQNSVMPVGGITKTDVNKIAVRWSSSEASIWVNGSVRNTSARSSSLSGLSQLDLGFNNSNELHARTKDLRVYPTALSDAELITLTTI